MNPGIAQGYLRFDTLLHRIIKILHANGPMRQCDILEELQQEDARGVSVSLARLAKHGFIYRCGKLHKYDTKDGRTQFVWSLEKPTEILVSRKATPRERTRRYRARKRERVSSVFDWRGPPEKRSHVTFTRRRDTSGE